MKKILIATIMASSLFSQPSLGNPMYLSEDYSIILSPVLSPVLSSVASVGLSTYLGELATTKTPIKVTELQHKDNNKTLVKGVAKDIPIEFETSTNIIKKAKVEKNSHLMVRDAKMGHILEYNNVALGLTPNPQHVNNFKQEKIN